MTSSFTTDRVAQSVQRATWLAATVGPFNPADLVRAVAAKPDEQRALAAQLAWLCAEVSETGAIQWNLRADVRRRALDEMQRSGLLASEELSSFMAQLSPAPADRFGQHLREALNGRVVTEPADREDLDALFSAYEFVGRSNVGAAPARARESVGLLDQHAQRAAVERQLGQTIGPVFVGRDRELTALRTFALTGELADEAFSNRARPSAGTIGMLFVQGVGGAGKSALLAKLVRELRQAHSGVAATIVLDFDRPTLATLDPIDLTLEAIRQIALSQPHLARQLSDLRRNPRDSDSRTSNARQIHFRDSRSSYELNQGLGAILADANVNRLPMLMILDTFEEVVTLGAELVTTIYRWVLALCDEANLMNVRVVISGRATPADLEADTSEELLHLLGTIPVGDLPPAEANVLLERRGIEMPLAQQLVELFGANPLVLRLLGDYAQQNGATAIQGLIESDDQRKKYQVQVAQRLLYSRILERIRPDKAVRALASPGLIVRVVTANIIRLVLAEPCGLGRISKERAEQLFSELARQVWLVRRLTPHAVTHRRDMRRLMLPYASIPHDSEHPAKLAKRIEDIHRHAFEYHLSRQPGDERLPAEISRNEALYHLLFLDPEQAFTDKRWIALLPNMESDAADFPIATRARLKRRLGKSLLESEIAALGEQERREYGESLDLLRSKRSTRRVPFNIPLATDRPIPAPRPLPRNRAVSRELSDAQIVDAFAAGQFEEVARQCGAAYKRFFSQIASRSGPTLERDMVDHATWLATVSTLVFDQKLEHRLEWAASLCDTVQEHWGTLTAQELLDKSGLTAAHYLTALAILLGHGHGLQGKIRELAHMFDQGAMMRRSRVRITSTASLRTFQLFMVALRDANGMLTPSTVQAPCLQYLAILLDPHFARHADPLLQSAQRAWFARRENLSSLRKTVDALRVLPRVTSSDCARVEREMIYENIDMHDWRGPRRRSSKGENSLPWAALQGMSHELRAPCLTALRQRFDVAKDGEMVLRRLGAASDYWPSDLSLGGIKQDRAVSDTVLATIGHYADRFGVLPLLFDGAKTGSIAQSTYRLYRRYMKLINSVPGAFPLAGASAR